MKKHILSFLLLGIAAFAARAEAPALLNYQGRLAVGAFVFEGTGEFKFALVNAEGSQTYWRNAVDDDHNGEPDNAVSLVINRGLYSVLLGDTNLAHMAMLPAEVFTNSALYLRVWFNDRVNGFQVLNPDQRVTASAYAMVAGNVPDGTITAAKLAPALSDQWAATNALLSAQIAALTAQLASLSNRVQSLSNSPASAGKVVVSTLSQDTNYLANGFEPVMTVAAPAWIDGTTTNAPSARYEHAAVWTGAAMIIWGGNLGSGVLSGSGGIYDPALDRWLTLSSVGAPSARSGAIAVWTGDEMLVWGGFAAGNYLASGGRYQPANQQWNSLPAAGAPSGRVGHIAGWTGSRLIVWGGRNSAGLLADGGIYEPATNQWSPLNLPGAPAARFGATAVWTGGRLLVWGGEGAAGALNSGAQLVMNAAGVPLEWRSISLSNAPAARSRHAAVWTGQKMIIWGGWGKGAFLGDGAVYDPAADSWVPTSSTNAPSGRRGHSALWTGQEMVVVGGEDASGAIASGSAYDPDGDQWRRLSSVGNPRPRSQTTVVWTGSELLCFGGQAGGQALGALQRLNPQPTWYFYRKP